MKPKFKNHTVTKQSDNLIKAKKALKKLKLRDKKLREELKLQIKREGQFK
jgi:hypothetical protein